MVVVSPPEPELPFALFLRPATIGDTLIIRIGLGLIHNFCVYSISQKFGHLFPWFFLRCILYILKAWKLWRKRMRLSRKPVLSKPEYVLCFGFFGVAHFCFDDSFAHSWHFLHQLREVVTWKGFPIVHGVPRGAEHLLAAFSFTLHPTHPEPSPLGLAHVIVEDVSSEAASITTYVAWGCLGSLSCWKINDGPTKCRPDGTACHFRTLW